MAARMLDAASDALIAVDAEGTVVVCSRAAAQRLALDAEAVEGGRLEDLFPDGHRLHGVVRDVLATGTERDVSLREAAGRPAVAATVAPLAEAHALVRIGAPDVPSLRASAPAPRPDAGPGPGPGSAPPAPSFLAGCDDGRLVDVNDAFADLLKRDRAGLLGLPLRDALVPVQAASWSTLLDRLNQAGSANGVLLRITHPDGTEHEVPTALQVMGVGGRAYLLGQVMDLNGPRQILAELEASEERWQLLIERHPDPVLVSEGGAILYTNPAAAHFMGADYVEELYDLTFFDVVEPSHHEMVRDRLESVQQDPGARVAEYPVRTLGGDLRYVETAYVPIEYGGRPAILTVARDVTERKRIEAALRRSERFLHGVIDALSAHIAVLDDAGTILTTNAAWQRFAQLNQAPDDLVRAEGVDYAGACLDAGDGEGVGTKLRDLLAGRRDRFTHEYPCHSPDEMRWFVMRASRFDIDGRGYAVIAHENITERVQAELALKREEARHRTLLDAIPDAVLLIRPSGYVVQSRMAEPTPPFTGPVAPGEHLQASLPEMYATLILEFVEECLRAREVRGWTHAAGPRRIEMRFVPQMDDEVLVMMRDVSVAHRQEANVLEAVSAAQRHIGRDLHDGLGQQLAGLLYLSGSLLRRLSDEAPSRALAERLQAGIQDAIDLSATLARGLNPVEIERKGLLYALLELSEWVETTYDVVCRVTQTGDVYVPDASAAYHLYRIAQEAVHNALKHSGSPTIGLHLERSDGHLVLEVHDDGEGFHPEDARGGMGLHTMRFRARMIGASLQIRAHPGEGTRVTCRLPQAEAASERANAASPPYSSLPGTS